MKKQPVTTEQMEDALLRSGYLLEARLESVLQQREYNVQASCPIPDRRTGISREMDLMALRCKLLDDADGTPALFNALLIECVNNSQPMAFITKDIQFNPLHMGKIKIAGIPTYGLGPERNKTVAYLLEMQEHHHYFKGRVATQWCTFHQPNRNNSESRWIATHDEERFNDFDKLCSATVFHEDRAFEAAVFSKHPVIQFLYPILVVQGDLVEVECRNEAIRLIERDHVQFVRSIITEDVGESAFHIDVVTERHFESFLGTVEQELTESCRRIEREQEGVKVAFQHLRAEELARQTQFVPISAIK